MSKISEKLEQQFPLEYMCIRFVAELTNVVRRVKANRVAAVAKDQEQTNQKESKPLSYYIHTDGIDDLLKKIQENFRLYIGISVDQPYHAREHAKAQFVCLDAFRKAYEKYLQEEINLHREKIDTPEIFGLPKKITKYRCDWPVELIIADSCQAFNKLPEVNINLTDPTGQCVKLLHEKSKDMSEQEDYYFKKGVETECDYREIFGYDNQEHQEDVVINFKMEIKTLRWSRLKKYYQDPMFIRMVDYIEECFKIGMNALVNKDIKKLPKEVRAQLGENWNNVVNINDLTYMSEIIMFNYVIFNPQRVNDENPVLMYPNRLDILFGAGKSLLAQKFGNQYISNSSFTCLWNEQFGHNSRIPNQEELLFSNQQTDQSVCNAVAFIRERIKRNYLEAKIVFLATQKQDVYPVCRKDQWLSSLRSESHFRRVAPKNTIDWAKFERMAIQDCIDKRNETTTDAVAVYSFFNLYMLAAGAKQCYHDFTFFLEHNENSPDYINIKAIYAEIVNHIYWPFFCRDYYAENRVNKPFHIELLSTYYNYTHNDACKLLIAARLDQLGGNRDSLRMYADLLYRRVAPCAQILNIMRTNEQSVQALFIIGHYLLESNFTDTRLNMLYQPILNYLKNAIEYYFPNNPFDYYPFRKDSAAEKNINVMKCRFSKQPSWTEIALGCLELASYNRIVPHVKANLYLSRLYKNGVPGHIVKSMKVASLTLEYIYAAYIEDVGYISLITETINKFIREDPNNIWIIFISGSVCQYHTNNYGFSLEFAQHAYDCYIRVYNAIWNDIYNQDNHLIFLLREKQYSLAMLMMKYANTIKDDSHVVEEITAKANQLIELSSRLRYGYASQHLVPAINTTSNQQLSVDDSRKIVSNYIKVTEYAIAELNEKLFQNTLSKFLEFVTYNQLPLHNLIASLNFRFNEMKEKLRYLEIKSARSNVTAVIQWCEGVFTGMQSRYEALIKSLNGRDAFALENSLSRPKIIIMLTDYYCLTLKKKEASIFFEDFKTDVSRIPQLDLATKEECRILINFYISIIDGNPENARQCINQAYKCCHSAFKHMRERFVLPIEINLSLRELFRVLDPNNTNLIDPPVQLQELK